MLSTTGQFEVLCRVSSNTRHSPQGVLSLDPLENLHGPVLGPVIDHDHLQGGQKP